MTTDPPRPHCLPGCDRLDGHDGRDPGACMSGGIPLDTPKHDHVRPNRAAQLATLALFRAALDGDRAAIRKAAIAGGCGSCNAVSATWFGITVVQSLPGMTPELAESAIRAAVEATEREMRSAGN